MAKLKRICLFLLSGYVTVCIVLMAFENSMVYPAPRFPRLRADQAEPMNWKAANYGAADVQFNSADGTALHGWVWEHADPQGYLLYCHGNGDCVGYLGDYLAEMSKRHRLTIFAFDYRGYGRSEGTPSERGVLADGAAARNWFVEHEKIKPAEVILMGRSLGGGVCVDLAAKSGARGLILQNTFTSLPDAAAKLYWFLPVHLLMRNQYRSLEKIGLYTGPVLQSHGNRDRIVPYELGQKLFAAAPGPKEFITLEGGDHNDLEPESYSLALERFLQSLPR